MAKVIMRHPNGVTKKVKVGFSWTTLCFGCFVPLIRGELGLATRYFFLALFTLGLAWFIIPFTINKRYREMLLERGYEICTGKQSS